MYKLGEQFIQSNIDGLCDDVQGVSQKLYYFNHQNIRVHDFTIKYRGRD